MLGATNPLAGVCGRVCPAPCMEGCNRVEYDGAVNIRALERWIADQTDGRPLAPVPESSSKRVAIVGGGPSGLSAAHTLVREGISVTIFEGEDQLGGVLRTGIPRYRLPREVVDREIQRILDRGVEARCGQFLDRDDLVGLAEDFDAVILSTGLQRLRPLDVEGAQLHGAEQGIHFLHRVNLGGPIGPLGRVVVLGGGNTAMDCARSAVRSGAREVTVLYRRSEREMPAIPEEVQQAREEGVRFQFLSQPVRLAGDRKVVGVELAAVRLGAPDETGRRRPVVTDRRYGVACDTVLLALGQSADLSLLPEGWELIGEAVQQVRSHGRDLPVLAAGDLATGEGTVTHAIGSGRRVALDVLPLLGRVAEPFVRPDRSAAVPASDIRFDHFARAEMSREQHRPADERRRTFEEVSDGLVNALEAHRCFSCGDCTRCDTCRIYCPEGIIRRSEDRYELDYSFCKGCGICVAQCPRQAMEMSSS